MKSVIIGGGGFLGSHLSEALQAAGQTVLVFDRPNARYLDLLRRAAVEVITGDFLNPADLARAIHSGDVVYHLASTTVPSTSNDDPVYDVQSNIIGSLGLFEAAKNAGARKIVFASSGGTVYGIPQGIPIREDHPTDPTSSHGICKLAIEKYLYYYWRSFGLDYCIMRISNAYGERQPVTGAQGVIAAFLDKALRSEELILWGNGTVVRDYVHVKDIASALVKAGLMDTSFKVFNIGSGKGHNLNEIILMIESLTERSMKLRQTPRHSFDVPINVLDIQRAKSHLSWHPTISLKEGIAQTYEWMLRESCKE